MLFELYHNGSRNEYIGPWMMQFSATEVVKDIQRDLGTPGGRDTLLEGV